MQTKQKILLRAIADLKKLIDEIPEGYSGGELGKVDSKNIEERFLNVIKGLPIGELSEA